MLMERLTNWLLPAFAIIIMLAAQYFVSYNKGGYWRLIVPAIFIIVLFSLFFVNIIDIASLIIYLIIGGLLLLEQGYKGQKKSKENN
ncbi:hypothetical protein [Staphylococcus edaphicus]|uniref:DUF2198 domain-containing protein n=1 Tax=Staphylococcus edaphicus TaxID=1955013 RepID=A0A2C6VII3_9STAP|nr:hypothetical protein [Staphylococcus edaphicus]PHK50041.1 hypothetical protein BTJ66_04580 [Staphylococcus edaphicus]UQW81533.1 hypothetical protein MNY58_13445 [Staphylococcus edaphicus]